MIYVCQIFIGLAFCSPQSCGTPDREWAPDFGNPPPNKKQQQQVYLSKYTAYSILSTVNPDHKSLKGYEDHSGKEKAWKSSQLSHKMRQSQHTFQIDRIIKRV